MIKFGDIETTNMTETEVLKKAKAHLRRMESKFGKGCMSLQDCVYSVIDAAMEYNQGK